MSDNDIYQISHSLTLPVHKVAQVYSDETSISDKTIVVKEMGPLATTMQKFLENEATLKPIDSADMFTQFDCLASSDSIPEIMRAMNSLSPGNGQIGYRQVIALVHYLRRIVTTEITKRFGDFILPEHSHVFGSGGDFLKTLHASTAASIICSPLVKTLKTGTINVTSEHGSQHLVGALNITSPYQNMDEVTEILEATGFAFLGLGDLGFPYSSQLRAVRQEFWQVANLKIQETYKRTNNWRQAVNSTSIPIDVLKVVSPNSVILNPSKHSTGVHHISLIPYVLAIYIELEIEGMIAYGFDGIDELSTASLTHSGDEKPNNLIIVVSKDYIHIESFSSSTLNIPLVDYNEIREEKSIEIEAKNLEKILSGKLKGAKRDFLVANAALHLFASEALPQNADDVDVMTVLSNNVNRINNLIDNYELLDKLNELRNYAMLAQ
ncbi:MAG: hypothetical protein AAF846_14270 [Chloroflexota bacterium]